jgi:hypothetical protein
MPPLFADDADWTPPESLQYSYEWMTRFVTPWKSFGAPLLFGEWCWHVIADICLLPSIGLLLSLSRHNVILLYSFSDGVTSIYAGSGKKGSKDGFRTKASFDQPHGLCLNSEGEILLCDRDNGRIRKISKDGMVTTFAGSRQGSLDGSDIHAQFLQPSYIAVAAEGGYFVSERTEGLLRHVSVDGKVNKIKYGLFVGSPVISQCAPILPPNRGQNIVCSTSGVYTIKQNGLSEQLVSAKSLGFLPTRAIALSSHLLLIASSDSCFVVDITDIANGELLITSLMEALGTDRKSVSLLRSLRGPFTFDASSGKIWIVDVDKDDNSLIEFHISDLKLASKDFPAPNSSSTPLGRPQPSSNDEKTPTEGATPIKYIIHHLTTTKELIKDFLCAPELLLAATPIGHIIKANSHDLLWYDPSAKLFKTLAGSSSKSGLLDGPRLDSLFGAIGGICFYPIVEDHGQYAPQTTTAAPSNDFFIAEESNSPWSSAKYRHNLVVEYDDIVLPTRRPDPARTKSFMLNLIGSEHLLLITDTPNHRIRELGLNGIVTTFAGSDKGALDGPKEEAKFSSPKFLKSGPFGDLFLVEANSFVIRRISVNGMVTTIDLGLNKFLEHTLIFHSVRPMGISSLEMIPGTASAMLVSLSHVICEISLKPKNGKEAKSICSLDDSGEWVVNVRAGNQLQGQNDGSIADSKFSSMVRFAAPMTKTGCGDGALPIGEMPLYLVDSGVVRCFGSKRVFTLVHGKRESKEGAAQRGSILGSNSLTCLPNGVLLTQDIHGQVLAILNSVPVSIGIYGFKNLMPKQNRPMAPFADYSVNLFGHEWGLHKNILQIRAPGMLDDHVVKQIAQHFKIDHFQHLLRAVYMDACWNEVYCMKNNSNSTKNANLVQRFEVLLDIYPSLLSIGNSTFTSSIESQIMDCYRLASHCPFEFLYEEEEEDVEDLFGDTYPSGVEKALPHVVIQILALLASAENKEASIKLLRLFLPHLTLAFIEHERITIESVFETLSARKEMFSIIKDYVVENRITVDGIENLFENHEEWIRQWRTLLNRFESQQHLDLLSTSSNTSMSLQPDFVIEGENSSWTCHKFVLSKAPFFETLLSAKFLETKNAKWIAAKDPNMPGYLSDSALAALLDYIYTDDTSIVNELDSNDRNQILSSLSFFFMNDAKLHLRIIGNVEL